MKTLQDFYKTTISTNWATGTGNRYVTTLPTPTSGWLVVSPNNATLREIVAYSAVGTDGGGNYVTLSARGVGGTTDQTHIVDEPVRMNITAGYWADIYANPTFTGTVTVPTPSVGTDAVTKDYADGLAIAGSPDSSTSTKGIGKTSVAPASATEPIFVGDNDPRVPTQDENNALVGTSGTPSTSNKYVTNDDTSDAAVSGKVVRATGTALPALDGTNLTGIAKVADIQTFTANDTWAKPAGAKSVLVQMWGGGGGGGGGPSTAMGGGGGGGGAYLEYTFNASDLSATEAIVVGTGGTATNVGGNSSFGSTKLIAYGGGGGDPASGGGDGGGGGGGGIASVGGTATTHMGGNGGNVSGGVGGSGAVGGISTFGGGGGGGSGNTGFAGGVSVHGGGGGGGGASNAGAPSTGGVGGSSFYGGGGGGAGGNVGAIAGTSVKGGAGGAGGSVGQSGTAGSTPGGGGGGGAVNGGAGARGQVTVITYF